MTIIAFNTNYYVLGLNVNECLFLSQFVHWSNSKGGDWFYKTVKEWTRETGLSRYQVDACRTKMRSIGVIEEQKKGLPSIVHYRLNSERLGELLNNPPVDNSLKIASISRSSLRETDIRYSKKLATGNARNSLYSNEHKNTQRIHKYKKEKNKKEKDFRSLSLTDSVWEVFEHWKNVHEHSRAQLDDKRKRLIKSRLDESYTVDDLKNAIDGCKMSAFHQGHNESGKKYDSIELILRNAGKVDAFIRCKDFPTLPKTKGQLEAEAAEISLLIASKTSTEA